jgi:hypothetical protein
MTVGEATTVTRTQAQGFSDTSIGIRGSAFVANPGEEKGGRNVNKIIVNVRHFNVRDYGSNFINVDAPFSKPMSQPTTRQAGQPNSMRFTGASSARTRFLGSTRRSARSMPSTSKSAVTPKGRIPNSRLPRGCLWPVPTSIWHCRPASCRRQYLEGMEQQRLFKLPQRLLRPRRTCRLQCHAELEIV